MFTVLRKLPVLPWVGNRLRIARGGGESDPAVLRGLACGAHLKYLNGEHWNALVSPPPAVRWERYRLKGAWGVTTRENWRSMLANLLDCEVSTPAWDIALGAREDLLARYGRLDGPAWAHEIGQALQARLGPGDPSLPAAAERLHRAGMRVERYEARFRQDGLLPPHGWVRRTLAWDLGRAANMACWGVAADFAAPDEAREALRTVGTLAEKTYGTWQEFSAAYVLGRCMHFDDDRFSHWYGDVRDSHRVLASRPDSPWASVALR